MFKIVRRIFALVALIAVATKGVFSLLSWVERQDDAAGNIWVDDDELEEVQ